MFCEKCGKELLEGDVFCTGCGTPVGENVVEKEANEASNMGLNQQTKPNDDSSDLENVSVEKEEKSSVMDSLEELATLKKESNTKPASIYLTRNSTATAFSVIGWIVLGVGLAIGITIIMFALSKSGSSSSSYYSVTSMFSGLGAGFGIGTIIVSIISGLGFFGVAEIIQLLQDQKTILMYQNNIVKK